MMLILACQHVIPFGPYAGKTVGQIGASEAGLLWMVFYRRECEARELPANRDLEAIASYLDSPTVAARVLCLPREALS